MVIIGDFIIELLGLVMFLNVNYITSGIFKYMILTPDLW